MSVLISNDAELDTLLDAQEVGHICEVVLAAEGVEREVEISLSYVDEDEMHELNHEWRGIDRTTDVLSFECDSAFDEDIPADEALELGDIILAPQVTSRTGGFMRLVLSGVRAPRQLRRTGLCFGRSH